MASCNCAPKPCTLRNPRKDRSAVPTAFIERGEYRRLASVTKLTTSDGTSRCESIGSSPRVA
jgi:hypothetical protein